MLGLTPAAESSVHPRVRPPGGPDTSRVRAGGKGGSVMAGRRSGRP
jgi:hypothetical protein